jgi:hypothetical protein
MRTAGIWMLVFGIGAFVLPFMGLQFKILAVFGEALPYVAGGLAVVGAILLALSFRGGPQPQTQEHK